MAYWYRRVFLLAFPLILSNLTQPLLSTVDTVLEWPFAGRGCPGRCGRGRHLLQYHLLDLRLFAHGHHGTGGAGARRTAARPVAAAFLARAAFQRSQLAALILVVQGPLIAVAIRLLGASDAVAENARLYSHIRIWSAPAALTNFVLPGYLLGRQRARAALAWQAALNVVNVCMALFLVLRLHWGVAGIATATASAEWAGCLLGLVLARDAT